jgi:PAS domain-containing protein
MAGLDLLDQAIAVFDATPKLVTWNKALLRLLDFPESLVRVGTPFEAFVRFNAERGEYGEGDIEKLVTARMASARSFQPHYVERCAPTAACWRCAACRFRTWDSSRCGPTSPSSAR